jgi:hypothetical protein
VISSNLAFRPVCSYNMYGHWVPQTPVGPKLYHGPRGTIRATFPIHHTRARRAPKPLLDVEICLGVIPSFCFTLPMHPFHSDEGR